MLPFPNEKFEHIDPSILAHFFQHIPGRLDIAIRILDSFLNSSPGLLATLRTALLDGGPDTIRRTAHMMKSSNAQIGAQSLAELCALLERQGAAGSVADPVQMAARLEEEYQGVEQELQRLRRFWQSQIT